MIYVKFIINHINTPAKEEIIITAYYKGHEQKNQLKESISLLLKIIKRVAIHLLYLLSSTGKTPRWT